MQAFLTKDLGEGGYFQFAASFILAWDKVHLMMWLLQKWGRNGFILFGIFEDYSDKDVDCTQSDDCNLIWKADG